MKWPGVILQVILQYLLVHRSFTMNVNARLALHSSCRAIINHFTPKIDSWAAVNHLTSMTSEQVCALLRHQSFYRLGVEGFKGDHLVFKGEWRGNQSSSTEYETETVENSQPVNCLGGGGGGGGMRILHKFNPWYNLLPKSSDPTPSGDYRSFCRIARFWW